MIEIRHDHPSEVTPHRQLVRERKMRRHLLNIGPPPTYEYRAQVSRLSMLKGDMSPGERIVRKYRAAMNNRPAPNGITIAIVEDDPAKDYVRFTVTVNA